MSDLLDWLERYDRANDGMSPWAVAEALKLARAALAESASLLDEVAGTLREHDCHPSCDGVPEKVAKLLGIKG